MMEAIHKLSSMLMWDFRIQLRYYFWVAAAIITAVWLFLLATLDEETSSLWIPVLIFTDISNIGLLFIAGILFLERSQGTLVASAVMPISSELWLTSKLGSLALLCTVCASALVYFNVESVNWWRVLPAIFLTSVLFASIGFILVCPFKKILNYFFAMALSLAVLNIPVLGYLGIFEHGLMWLLPSQAAMVLLAVSFTDASAIEFYSALGLLLIWLILAHWVGIKLFKYFNIHD